MLTDAQIDVAVRLNTATLALHEAIKLTIRYGWPNATLELRQALAQVLATHKEVTEDDGGPSGHPYPNADYER